MNGEVNKVDQRTAYANVPEARLAEVPGLLAELEKAIEVLTGVGLTLSKRLQPYCREAPPSDETLESKHEALTPVGLRIERARLRVRTVTALLADVEARLEV